MGICCEFCSEMRNFVDGSELCIANMVSKTYALSPTSIYEYTMQRNRGNQGRKIGAG